MIERISPTFRRAIHRAIHPGTRGLPRAVGIALQGLALMIGLAATAHAATVPVTAKGTIKLWLAANDRFEWYPTGGNPLVPAAIQAIGAPSGCGLVTGSNLMAVSSAGAGTPAFRYDSIGIYAGGSSTSGCARTSVGEGPLRLTLGNSSFLAGLVIARSSLDIEAKKNAVVRADVYNDLISGAMPQTFYLITGTAKTNPAYATLPNADRSCSPRSDWDSEPEDEDSRNNCRWNINAVGTRIELRALAGEFGLEGGEDHTGPSTFDVGALGDGILGCPSTGGSTINTADAPTLTGIRQENVTDPLLVEAIPSCRVVPYDVSTTCPTGYSGTCTSFVYDFLDQGTHMAFLFHWEWPLVNIPVGGIAALQNTLQFFINGNAIGADLDFCPEVRPTYDGNGNPTGINPSFPPVDQEPLTPGTQAGCLLRRQVLQIGGQLRIIEDAYVEGDYGVQRN